MKNFWTSFTKAIKNFFRPAPEIVEVEKKVEVRVYVQDDALLDELRKLYPVRVWSPHYQGSVRMKSEDFAFNAGQQTVINQLEKILKGSRQHVK